MKEILEDFKQFILRGNVFDMAIGIIIGVAFSKIVDSLVKDIIMPPIGLIIGKVDFSNLYFQLFPLEKHYSSLSEAQNAGAVTINYGIFINTIISFLIIAMTVFLMVKGINNLQQKTNTKENNQTKKCPYCFNTINIQAVKCPFCTADL